jgi:hypothetical protein
MRWIDVDNIMQQHNFGARYDMISKENTKRKSTQKGITNTNDLKYQISESENNKVFSLLFSLIRPIKFL